MRIESERIKKTMKDICEKEGNLKPYELMCEILDHLHLHDNAVSETRDNQVKELIDKGIRE